MDLFNLIPTHKDDMDRAEQLAAHSYDDVKFIVTELLQWIQDGHWPVAETVSRYLSSIAAHIQTEITIVLNGDDDIWKRNCLGMLMRNPGAITDEDLLQTIHRIIEHPTAGEIEEEVHEAAASLMSRMKSM